MAKLRYLTKSKDVEILNSLKNTINIKVKSKKKIIKIMINI